MRQQNKALSLRDTEKAARQEEIGKRARDVGRTAEQWNTRFTLSKASPN